MNNLVKKVLRLHPRRIPELVRYLLKDEAISGRLVIVTAIVALVIANSPLGTAFTDFWHTKLSIGSSTIFLSMDIKHWINEGLMTFFFLVVGLEIKRELVKGELRHFKTALLPIVAAIGGMVFPALLYILINAGSAHGIEGWAIPIATDIALAVSLLAIVGKGIPSSLRLFLLTLAIVDDIGAIIVVAIFYGTGFNFVALAVAILVSGIFILVRKKRWLTPPVFAATGIVLWFLILKAGIEASIAGALLGLLAPVIDHTHKSVSLAERVEKYIIPLSTLFVVPLFVLANAGINLSSVSFTDATISVGLGIVVGLVLGKVLGIVATSWVLVKLRIADLPTDTSWRQFIGIGCLAGIGFTVSLFISDLSFTNEVLSDFAKASIFVASIISASIGIIILRTRRTTR